jgi:hypothetical protein
LGHIYFLFLAMAAAVDSVPRITRNMLPRAIFARSVIEPGSISFSGDQQTWRYRARNGWLSCTGV